jgi:hypothetical protein
MKVDFLVQLTGSNTIEIIVVRRLSFPQEFKKLLHKFFRRFYFEVISVELVDRESFFKV